MSHSLDALADRLTATLGPKAVRPPEPRHLEEPRGRWHGAGGIVVTPASTEEVAAAIQIASETRTPVLPYSGGTGLVGGQIMEEAAAIILSTERMSQIRAVYPEENVIVADAGCTLAAIQEAAAEAGRLFPLSYGSEGTARIGGALSVNSGGINVVRYGMARDLCLGIEAVMPDGGILHGLKRLKKDNTGYDIRNLMIGAEGTLGVITGAALRLSPRPTSTGTAMMVVPDPDAALALFHRTQARVGDAVSAFELISGMGFAFLTETGFDYKAPFDTTPAWVVLVEIGTFGDSPAETHLEALFAEAFEAGLVSDGVIASSGQQRAELWHIRETIPLANKAVGSIASNDISLPLSELPGFLAEAERALSEIAEIRINAFGHLGDGNMHFNFFPPAGQTRDAFEDVRHTLSKVTNEMVVARGGSFSAEHGVGRLKVGALEDYGDPVRLAVMRQIKATLDPHGIMNPGAVLRAR